MRYRITALIVLLGCIVNLLAAQDTTITSQTLRKLDIFHTIPIDPSDGTALTNMFFTADNRLLITQTISASDIYIWDVETGLVTGKLTASKVFFDMAVAHQQNWVVTLDDSQVSLWDLTSFRRIKDFNSQQKDIYTFDVQFSPDDAWVYVSRCFGSAGCEIVIWDTIVGSTASQHIDVPNTIIDFRVSPDGTQLAIADDTNRITLWNIADQREVEVLELAKPATHLTFSADGQKVIASYQGLSGLIWDFATDAQQTLPDFHYEDFISTGNYVSLLYTLVDDQAMVVNLLTSESVASLDILYEGEAENDFPAFFSPDGSIITLNSHSNGRTVVLYGLEDQFAIFRRDVFYSTFSSNGQYFAIYDLLRREITIMHIASK